MKSQITHTHETSGESGVLSDLAIDGDVAFLVVDDHGDFSTSQSVLKTVPNQEIQLEFKRLLLLQDDSERKGFSVFVGALGGLSGLEETFEKRKNEKKTYEDTAELVKHPALGSGDSL